MHFRLVGQGFSCPLADVCLLTNFVSSSLALRQLESFTPLCLPSINDRQEACFLPLVLAAFVFVCLHLPSEFHSALAAQASLPVLLSSFTT